MMALQLQNSCVYGNNLQLNYYLIVANSYYLLIYYPIPYLQ